MNRRVIVRGLTALTAIWLAGGWTLQAQDRPEITKTQVDQWMQDLSNWGRWGDDDQLGAVNLITPAKRREALALATTGDVVSLSLPISVVSPPDDPNSTAAFTNLHVVNIPSGFLMERQQVAFHGSTVSHLDALCHAHHEGRIYNGVALEDAFNEDGCSRMGISGLAGGIVTRGVLLDIPRLKGLDALETGTHVYPEDIEAWERQTGVTVSAGDAIFLRTGRWVNDNRSGYDITVAPWLKERDAALVGSDGTQDVGQIPGTTLPFHKLVLVALGANIFDNMDLEALAETAARLNRWEFLLVAAPIPNPGGTGSPLNPLAIF
ncbi:MAG: cyclase family protein [Vicinamibacterales bacterium]|jgi:kynurenine formamidase|nr:cyclase family protein [Vicinamibacterales bacterium]MDP7692161.1 cyclase family protein [Vicinamibacterales bacterium]HJN42588.1 cyclase family protein [Vicinamibacterales bacterium]